jgi:hypothetical protein
MSNVHLCPVSLLAALSIIPRSATHILLIDKDLLFRSLMREFG